MSEADGVKIQIEQLLDQIGQLSIISSELRSKAGDISGGLVLLGLSIKAPLLAGLDIMNTTDEFTNALITAMRTLSNDLKTLRDSL